MLLDELNLQGKEVQEMFTTCCNKLLFNSFLCKDKKDNLKYYLFISSYQKYFDEFFAVLGDDLIINQDLGTIHLKNNYNQGLTKLTKEESIILLILRILYQEKLINTTLKNVVEITVDDLYKKILSYNFKKKIFKTELDSILKSFKKYNIVDNLGDMKYMTSHILIFPSITQLIPTNNIIECYNYIIELEKGKKTEDENTNENKIN